MGDSKGFLSRALLHMVCIAMLVSGLRTYGSTEEGKRDLSKQTDVEAYVDESTGFAELEGISKSFERVDINDDNTPFLHTQINGKKGVWRVEIRNVRLKLKSAVPGFKDKYVRNFEVLIDPNTGHLLKITSTFDGNDPNMLPEPPAAIAESKMRGSQEVYLGFPAEPPMISFLDALDCIWSTGVGTPYEAKEIYAVHVMHSKVPASPLGWQLRALWVITLRGIPPISFVGDAPIIPGEEVVQEPGPVWQRNHLRYGVDAVTSKVLFATNSPQPLPPEQKKKK